MNLLSNYLPYTNNFLLSTHRCLAVLQQRRCQTTLYEFDHQHVSVRQNYQNDICLEHTYRYVIGTSYHACTNESTKEWRKISRVCLEQLLTTEDLQNILENIVEHFIIRSIQVDHDIQQLRNNFISRQKCCKGKIEISTIRQK
ncbi:Hypothetical_protein [Hexamita inflata]|uniref:Hypothetical_protein n=1 Tax=Hexamita inflata TaxID=28002 RepID=A0ABP1HCH1_9EUKA